MLVYLYVGIDTKTLKYTTGKIDFQLKEYSAIVFSCGSRPLHPGRTVNCLTV